MSPAHNADDANFERWTFNPAVTLTSGTETDLEVSFVLAGDVTATAVFTITTPEQNEAPQPTASPQTGDTGNMGQWAMLGLSSVALLAGLIHSMRRRTTSIK